MKPVHVSDVRHLIAPPHTSHLASHPDGILKMATVAVLALFAFLATYQIQAPDASPGPVGPEQFAVGRALRSAQEIARTPHPMGSAEHAAVRRYLLQQLTVLGCEVDVQTTTGVSDSPAAAGDVANVVGLVHGEQGTQAIMLVAHYDGVPTSPAAADDGAGVAALLETLRALRAGPPLKNDVIILFTDGEEDGLLGASAFTREHPWARNVRLVLNFEARGSSGPSLLFETTPGNGWLVREVARAAPHPVGSSLLYAIYRYLPNDTDLSIFKRAGWQGLNFAFIGGQANYHTPRDDMANLSGGSLSHHGSYALALTRQFGNLDLRHPDSEDVVFFNLLGAGLVIYPESWSVAMFAPLLLVYVVLTWLSLRRHRLTVRPMLLGVMSIVIALVITVSASLLSWWLVQELHRSVLRSGQPGGSVLYLASFLALGMAATLVGYRLLRLRVGTMALAFGSMTLWLLLSAASSWHFRPGSYLFSWPVASALMALGALTSFRGTSLPPKSLTTVLSWLAAGIPIVVVAPIIAFTYMGLGLTVISIPILVTLVALTLWLLVPVLELLTAGTWHGAALAALVWLVFLLAGAVTVRYDRNHPKARQIIYSVDADMRSAKWASFDEQPDAWSVQFLTTTPRREPLPALTPDNPSQLFLQSQAPLVRLPPPEVKVVHDTTTGARRVVTLLLRSPRRARVCLVYVTSPRVLAAQVAGRDLARQGRHTTPTASIWKLQYTNLPAKGAPLVLEIPSGPKLRLRIVEASHGLPDLGMSFSDRPDEMMESGVGDLTVVSRAYEF